MLKIFRKLFTVAFSLLVISALYTEESLPTGFKNIHFGMSVDEVKEELKKDASFGFRGDRDVSLLPGERETSLSPRKPKETGMFPFCLAKTGFL